MLRANMRRFLLTVLVSAVALGGSAVALAHNGPYSWTAAKAQVMLQEGTMIALPADQRAALEAELRGLLDQFRLLQLTAQERSEDWLAAATYDNYLKRFERAQASVSKGLSIDAAKCLGQGKALSGKRYKHFRCSVTSYVLEIPSVELKPGKNPSLPDVVEGPVRRIGPLAASFTVHVMGKSRMLSQRAS
jgi:hypothetical protein